MTAGTTTFSAWSRERRRRAVVGCWALLLLWLGFAALLLVRPSYSICDWALTRAGMQPTLRVSGGAMPVVVQGAGGGDGDDVIATVSFLYTSQVYGSPEHPLLQQDTWRRRAVWPRPPYTEDEATTHINREGMVVRHSIWPQPMLIGTPGEREAGVAVVTAPSVWAEAVHVRVWQLLAFNRRLWPAVGVLCVATAVGVGVRLFPYGLAWRLRRRGQCPRCGYAGQPGVCPECGLAGAFGGAEG